jgi:8-oxo-dGTP pyrophosphatase MutT (NUDIX family)
MRAEGRRLAVANGIEAGGRKQSAVLVPVFRDGDGELRLVLVVRGVRGVHGGQLGLPGGRSEPQDASPLATALREAEEEIGLPPSDVEVLASLAPIDSRTTGFRVHRYLARVRPREWRPAAGEISGVVTPLVRALADPERGQAGRVRARRGRALPLGPHAAAPRSRAAPAPGRRLERLRDPGGPADPGRCLSVTGCVGGGSTRRGRARGRSA